MEQHFTPHMEKENLYFSGWKKKDRRGILGISAFEWIYLLCCLMWTLFVSAKQVELLFHAGKAQDNVPRDTKARAFPTRHITCRKGIFDTIPKILNYLFLEISGGEGKTPHLLMLFINDLKYGLVHNIHTSNNNVIKRLFIFLTIMLVLVLFNICSNRA